MRAIYSESTIRNVLISPSAVVQMPNEPGTSPAASKFWLPAAPM